MGTEDVLKNIALAVCIVGALSVPAAQSMAADVPIMPGHPPLGLPLNVSASPVSSSTAAMSMGAIAVTGFIGFVAVICAYDLYLKISGQKNWDGTPKVVQVVHHGHHS